MSARIVPEMWLAGRDLTEPRLSPNGGVVAYVTSWGSRSAIAVMRVDGSALEQLITSLPEPRSGRGFGGGCFDWMPDGSAIVYAGRDGGLWSVPSTGGAPSAVVQGDAARPAQCPVVSPSGEQVAFVVDMAAIGVVSMADGSVQWAPVEADFVVDPSWSADGTTLVWQEWSVPSMAWDSSAIRSWTIGQPTADVLVAPTYRSIQQPRLDSASALWSVRDDSGYLNVSVGDQPVVAEPFEHAGPTWGLGQRTYALSPDGTQVALARNEGGFGRLVVIDRASGHVTQLGRGVHGQVGWRGSVVSALRSGGRTPIEVVVYDLAAGSERRRLAKGPVAGFDDGNLVEPELVSWAADDGATIHGRLYRSAENDGRLLCWIHGGPTDQWQVTFIPRIAYWVQQGWSVLVPDHRGSTGHGREYQQAMRERWGVLDVSDTAAGIAAAHRDGWGRPEYTVAVGSSAGGFTVLNLCRRFGSLVAGAIVLYPVSDLAALDAGTHRFEAHYNATLVGQGVEVFARYVDRSPLLHPDEIRTPLLLMHGSDDAVVPVAQSRALAEALQGTNTFVEFVEYQGEGHGFRMVENQLDEVRRTAAFLDRCLTRGFVSP
jgi:dipeptidyl aminopeptidase/acylaminoacyl peptidase